MAGLFLPFFIFMLLYVIIKLFQSEQIKGAKNENNCFASRYSVNCFY